MSGAHQTTAGAAAWRRQLWTAWSSATLWLVIGSALLALVIAAGGDAARGVLRYERVAIVQHHQYWRLLSGHWVHASWQHLWLNLAGLALIATLCRGCYAFGQWCQVLAIVLLTMAGGLVVLMPQLVWYVGLSGVLHGILAAGAVRWWRIESPWLAALLSGILLAKLGWEQLHGALPLAGELPVVVNAHLYGAAGGLLAALWLALRERWLAGDRPRS